MTAKIYYLSDRRWGMMIEDCWSEALAARAPDDADNEEFRACARRRARLLGTSVSTSIRNGRAIAVANDGYPLGLVDDDERERWAADAADAAPFRTGDGVDTGG